jgi:hypothetical protein
VWQDRGFLANNDKCCSLDCTVHPPSCSLHVDAISSSEALTHAPSRQIGLSDAPKIKSTSWRTTKNNGTNP